MKSVKSTLTWRYFAVLCAALVLYIISCAPGVLWQDSGLIQYRIWHNDIEGFFGLALSHPLFYLVAIAVKTLPFGEFAHRINMVSAIAGAAAVANMFLLVRLWVGKDIPAVIAAANCIQVIIRPRMMRSEDLREEQPRLEMRKTGATGVIKSSLEKNFMKESMRVDR